MSNPTAVNFDSFLKENAEADHRIQARGHCQVCGREQAVRNGKVAKHGYTIADRGLGGWFHGTCPGADYPTLEVNRDTADLMIRNISRDVQETKEYLSKVESGSFLFPREVNLGTKIRPKMVKWSDLTDLEKRRALAGLKYQLEGKIKSGIWTIDAITKNIAEFHGKEHREVKIAKGPDPSKVISVGEKVKVAGREVVVTKIDFAAARGVGPGINGKVVEHVYWEQNGKTMGYPKRYAKKVVA